MAHVRPDALTLQAKENQQNPSFRTWQHAFYSSNTWLELRDRVRIRDRMRCQACGKLIRGRAIVDHIDEITPENKDDPEITLNPENLQLLCQECHNSKHFEVKGELFDVDQRDDPNLF